MPRDHELPELGFTYDALEPYVDAATLESHHGDVHAGHVAALNASVEGATALHGLDVEDLLRELPSQPAALLAPLRTFGGGHANHRLLFRSIGPPDRHAPAGLIAETITRDFGSIGAFRGQLSVAARTRFGSGWAWLALQDDGHLMITTTPDEESPLSEGLIPILGIDLWEHAYTLQYGADRRAYVEAFWRVIDWESVNEIFVEAEATAAASKTP